MSSNKEQTAQQDVNTESSTVEPNGTDKTAEVATEQSNPEAIPGQAVDSEDNVAASDTAEVLQMPDPIERLRKESEDNYQRFLRAQADFDNFRRRSRQEKEEFAKYASLKIIEQMLPVMDNFERALNSSKETKDFDALLKGIEMTSRQLTQVMEQEGLKMMETVGQPFNPEIHQAVMQVDSAEHEEGIIVEEIQKGYMLKDKVIRPAMVKVSS